MSPGPDKYDVSGNVEAQFVDEAQQILVNKRGFADLTTLQIAEEEGLTRAYATLFSEVRLDTAIDCDLIRLVHQRIFGDLYEWAGRWRTVQISKPGAIWPAAQFLDQSMTTFEADVLPKYARDVALDDESFCSLIGEVQGEFLAIHPFREGNARTIKLITDLIAAQTKRPLLRYDESSEGQARYILAASAALAKKDYGDHPRRTAGGNGGLRRFRSSRKRRRVSSENGGSPSMTLLRSAASRMRFHRSSSFCSQGQTSRSVGPFPKLTIRQL
jgi:cell filamentation protein